MITEGSLQDFRLPDLLQILAIGSASASSTKGKNFSAVS